MRKVANKALICVLLSLSVIFTAGFSISDSMEYRITYHKTETTINCIWNDDGILLLPLLEVTKLIDYNYTECGRCGNDEIYSQSTVDKKGYIIVNWYKDVITYSNDPMVVSLDAVNERIDGITYTSPMLYQYLGLEVIINEEEKSITITDGAKIDRNESESNVVDDLGGAEEGIKNKEAKELNLKPEDTTVSTGAGGVLIYFYSTTCSSCKSAVDYINTMKDRYPDLTVQGYNIYIPENITLLKAYGNEYSLSKDEIGDIPAAFLSETSMIGNDEILIGLEETITGYDTSKPTHILDTDSIILEKNILNGLAVFGAGMLNGINPCSLSMFLFLLSLIMADLKKIIKVGVSFCLGKFMMFFLLGSIFYKFISKMDTAFLDFITKELLLIIIIAFAVLNIYDFIMAKREKYQKMILQLPSWLKGFNQRIMKKSTKYSESPFVLLLIVLIGMILAMGEFLCTGQIYLTSIIVLIQDSSLEWLSVFYLILYSLAFVLPLIILTMLVYYGKKVFGLSEKLLNKLPLIKIISSILYIIFGIYVVFSR